MQADYHLVSEWTFGFSLSIIDLLQSNEAYMNEHCFLHSLRFSVSFLYYIYTYDANSLSQKDTVLFRMNGDSQYKGDGSGSFLSYNTNFVIQRAYYNNK